jgi:hypothetical protein
VQSPFFEFIMPGQDNVLGLPGVTAGSSVADGYWLILEPLAPGDHVLHFEGYCQIKRVSCPVSAQCGILTA